LIVFGGLDTAEDAEDAEARRGQSIDVAGLEALKIDFATNALIALSVAGSGHLQAVSSGESCNSAPPGKRRKFSGGLP